MPTDPPAPDDPSPGPRVVSDAAGRPVWVRDAAGHVTWTAFDSDGQPLTDPPAGTGPDDPFVVGG